jgi:NADH dehydrogenase FAD-containing subunit
MLKSFYNLNKNLFCTNNTKSKILREKSKIVVLGTGWAGFRFVKGLDKKFWDITVISPRNHFIFTPLLASTTVGTLEFRAIIEPIRTICQNYIQGECKQIDSQNKKVICYDTYHNVPFEKKYDYLVIAVGSTPNTFNIPGVKENCFFLRQIQDARNIRKRLLECLEKASSPLCSPEEKKKLLSFVVVGGGPTSIEFSAELHDFLESDFKRWYPNLSLADINITVIESTDHILGMFDKNLSLYAERYLKNRQQINILTNAKVTEVKPGEIILKDNKPVEFGLCVWSTGNRPIELIKSLDFPKDKTGRIEVDGQLKVKGYSDIFAVGDCAQQIGSSLPQTAQCAQQEGVYLIKLFNKMKRGHSIEEFHFSNKGVMSYIGGNKAIVDLHQAQGKGFFAWLFWRSAYLTRLVSIRNKILVIMYWFKTLIFGRDISMF